MAVLSLFILMALVVWIFAWFQLGQPFRMYFGIPVVILLVLIMFWTMALSGAIYDKAWYKSWDEFIKEKEELKQLNKQYDKYIKILGDHEAVKKIGEEIQTKPRLTYLRKRYLLLYKNSAGSLMTTTQRKYAKERLNELELFIKEFPEFKEATKIDF